MHHHLLNSKFLAETFLCASLTPCTKARGLLLVEFNDSTLQVTGISIYLSCWETVILQIKLPSIHFHTWNLKILKHWPWLHTIAPNFNLPSCYLSSGHINFAIYCVNKIATTLIFVKVSNADHSILESSVKLTELYNLACFGPKKDLVAQSTQTCLVVLLHYQIK